MNILLISDDGELADALSQSRFGRRDELVVVADPEAGLHKLAEGGRDAVILSDRLLDAWPATVMDDIRRLAGGAKLAVLLSDRHADGAYEQRAKECLADGWAVVPPGRSAGQVAEQIGEWLHGESGAGASFRNGLIQFVGTTPNIGTTVAAFAAASAMAARSNRTIGLLCLHLKSDKLHRYLGESEPDKSLDGLRPELKAGMLSPERLKAQCRQLKPWPNLYILHGNMRREQADYYTVVEMEHLFQAAEQAFDLSVADTGAYWDNAAIAAAMRHAGQRILVTTPQESCYREDFSRWCQTLAPMFGLSPADFDLLVTQKDDRLPASPRAMAREMGLTRIGEIRKCPVLETSLETGRLAEWAAAGSKGARDGARLAEALLALRDEPIRATVNPKRSMSWRGLFRGGRRIGFAGK